MRRWLLAALLFVGCGDPRDRGVVARVDDSVLTEERMAELLVLAQPFPLDSAPVHDLARYWVGAASFAARSLAGDDLATGPALEEASWLERREALLQQDREDRLGAAVRVDRREAGAVYDRGELRLVAHLLRRVGPETSSEEQLLQKRTADRILQGLIDGGSWPAAVAESEDENARVQGGLLGLVGPSELQPTLSRAAFRLEPGQVSGVIQTRDGYHIVYRPRFEEVSGLFATLLRARRLEEADAAAAEELVQESGLALEASAGAEASRIALEPWRWLESTQVLASWAGGELTAGVLARYIVFLPDPSKRELAAAEGEAADALVRDIALRELRLAGAAERGLTLDASSAASIAEGHAADVEAWREALGLRATGAPNAGSADAGALNRHMEAVVSRRREGQDMSPSFEAWLLNRVDWAIQGDGVLRAIQRARRMVDAAAGPPSGSGL